MVTLQLVQPRLPGLDPKASTKALRAALKAAFPGTKFSVTRPNGGSSVYVAWTDGPLGKEVDEVTNAFESKGFDGMTDCSFIKKTSVEVDGVSYSSSIGYILTQRDISDALKAEAICAIFDEGYDGCDRQVNEAAWSVANGTPIYIAAQDNHLTRNQ